MVRIRVPGDKSISHRVLMLATLAEGESRLRGVSDAADVASTAAALRGLGAAVPDPSEAEIRVAGPARFRDAGILDCGNSGTTARLLLGLVAGLGVEATLDGDASLRRRPMDRVVYPLQAMGARLAYEGEHDRLPVRAAPRATGALRTLRHRPRVASAQVKSALLLAGLAARIDVEVVEPGRSRDHTERLLAAMGAPLTFGPEEVGARARLEAGGWEGALRPLDLAVPGDASAAAFLGGAALLAGREVRVEGVGLNPTRTGFLEVLRAMGAEPRVRPAGEAAGEPVGALEVAPAALEGTDVPSELVPRLLDEIPLLAVLAARARGTTRFRGAGELRVKESDRLARLAAGLRAVGAACRELEDGLEVEGGEAPLRGTVETGGDHRIAMAFGCLDAAPGCRVRVDDPGCVAVSFPGFWETLARVTGEDAPAPGPAPAPDGAFDRSPADGAPAGRPPAPEEP